jgi:hypothetical protein
MNLRQGCSLTIRLLFFLVVLVWPAVLVAAGFADSEGGAPSLLPNDKSPAYRLVDPRLDHTTMISGPN